MTAKLTPIASTLAWGAATPNCWEELTRALKKSCYDGNCADLNLRRAQGYKRSRKNVTGYVAWQILTGPNHEGHGGDNRHHGRDIR